MQKHLFTLALLVALICSCVRTENSNNSRSNTDDSHEGSTTTTMATVVDTPAVFTLVTNALLDNLEADGSTVVKFDQDDYRIEFDQPLTEESETTDVYSGYVHVEPWSLITGELNGDGKADFAVRSLSGPLGGNHFTFYWHIYVSDGDRYTALEASIIGGKFGPVERVVDIIDGRLITSYRSWDETLYKLEAEEEMREYEVLEGILVLKD